MTGSRQKKRDQAERIRNVTASNQQASSNVDKMEQNELSLTGNPVDLANLDRSHVSSQVSRAGGTISSVGEAVKKRITTRQNDIIARKFTNPGRRQSMLLDLLQALVKPAASRDEQEVIAPPPIETQE